MSPAEDFFNRLLKGFRNDHSRRGECQGTTWRSAGLRQGDYVVAVAHVSAHLYLGFLHSIASLESASAIPRRSSRIDGDSECERRKS